MTVAVVDRLEIIHIHGDQRQWLAETLGTFARLPQETFQPIAVGNPRERITLGQLAVLVQLALQLLVDPGQFAGPFGDLGFQRLVSLLKLRHQPLARVDVAVRPQHARHRAIGVAANDVATVLDPQVAAVVHTTAVLDEVALAAVIDVRLEMRHDPRVIFRVDHAFPGEHRVGHGVAGIAEHGVPARIAIHVPGVGIPVPDAVADQLEQGVQLLLTEPIGYGP
ncbi:hypothetical protein D3C71_1588890 [compost metagenome]